MPLGMVMAAPATWNVVNGLPGCPSPFTADEVALAKRLNSQSRRRAILLTSVELEPNRFYERTMLEFTRSRPLRVRLFPPRHPPGQLFGNGIPARSVGFQGNARCGTGHAVNQMPARKRQTIRVPKSGTFWHTQGGAQTLSPITVALFMAASGARDELQAAASGSR
jgi:hypothetical protein